jgi:RNA polymerase sigma-70 factor, ECF subfamily
LDREDEIAGRIRMGDIKAFESLFRSSYSSLVRYSASIVKDQDTAEEVVQDLFYRLWKEREKLIINSSLNGYLFRSTYNRSLKWIEHMKVVKKYESDASLSNQESPATPLQQLQLDELHEVIAGTLEKLPDRCGEIFYLNRFEGLKYREIADRLSISVKTVEANMGKALKEFRKTLGEL